MGIAQKNNAQVHKLNGLIPNWFQPLWNSYSYM